MQCNVSAVSHETSLTWFSYPMEAVTSLATGSEEIWMEVCLAASDSNRVASHQNVCRLSAIMQPPGLY